MTEEEFRVIRGELELLSRALNIAVRQIVEQRTSLDALIMLLEQKHVASPEEIERARKEAARDLAPEEPI